MADKELRKMNRTELIEIIYALQQNERTLREENERLQGLLDDKTIRLERSGSIAEAALDLNHIFEDAEAAAQQYLDSLAKSDGPALQIIADAEKRAAENLADAEKRAAEILADAEGKAAETIADAEGKAAEAIADAEMHAKETEDECRAMKDKASSEIQRRVDAFTESVSRILKKYPELDAYMRKESGL